MKTKYILLTIFAAILFNGCVTVTKQMPPFETYTLKAKKSDISTGNINYAISVKEPEVLTSINNSRITYSKENRYEQYALSKWSDKPSKMIQNEIIKHLSQNGSYRYTVSSSVNIKSDYTLISEIDEFEQFFKGGESFVKLNTRVFLKGYNGDIFFKKFYYIKKCSQNDARGAVEGFNKIISDYVSDLNMFIAESLK